MNIFYRENNINFGECNTISTPSLIKKCLIEDKLSHQSSIKKFTYKDNGKKKGGIKQFKDFENFRKQRKIEKEMTKSHSKLRREGSNEGRKLKNASKENRMKMSHEDLPKNRHKENI